LQRDLQIFFYKGVGFSAAGRRTVNGEAFHSLQRNK
jgi:hypothetical protein